MVKNILVAISFLGGVTILGNGNVCLTLNISGILNTLTSQISKTINACYAE